MGPQSEFFVCCLLGAIFWWPGLFILSRFTRLKTYLRVVGSLFGCVATTVALSLFALFSSLLDTSPKKDAVVHFLVAWWLISLILNCVIALVFAWMARHGERARGFALVAATEKGGGDEVVGRAWFSPIIAVLVGSVFSSTGYLLYILREKMTQTEFRLVYCGVVINTVGIDVIVATHLSPYLPPWMVVILVLQAVVLVGILEAARLINDQNKDGETTHDAEMVEMGEPP